jgi:predicted CoA-substrate-specific enzyme activase
MMQLPSTHDDDIPLRLRMGIDIGSVSAKVVVLDPEGHMAFSAYRRHRAETSATLCSLLQEATEALGNVTISPMITGSAGMGVSERYGIPFIQEVIASAEVVKRLYPQVRTLVDIGGEDAKLTYFNRDGIPDIRMNGTCAGGTGAYIDEMAALLNVPVGDLSALAERSTRIYPMASRCGVFGKTDVQNLLSREVAHPDIAASILHAVVLQTLTTLTRGLDLEPLILFSGGPLTFIPALRAAFLKELGFEPEQMLAAAHTELLPATGAALAQRNGQQPLRLSALAERLNFSGRALPPETQRLTPLFTDEAEWQRWETARWQNRIERIPVSDVAGEPCFLGVDSGSTTTKIVLVDRKGRLAFTYYANNSGSAIGAARNGLEKMREAFAACEHPPYIARGVATGYGEDLIRTAFGLDEGIVETVAHFRGAKAFDPDVSFILDIGGQDMKAIFVRDGHITNIELNEACSSGCGTFIQTFARSMGHNVSDFARMACTSAAPCDLGTRCTVFMNSSIKQALKEAAEVGDISAGLAYSVIKNALHKVLRITDTSILGEHIVVQGGTFRNPAVHRAFEKLLGREVICPDIAELMGAYGAALRARDTWLNEGDGQFPGLEGLAQVDSYDKRQIGCRGCENRCTVTKLRFPNGGTFFTGNRCERIYSNHGTSFVRGTSLTDHKLELLFDRSTEPSSPARLTLGLPRIMNLYENFPFWNTLLVECGFKVQLSDTSNPQLYARGVGSVMSDNICFPAKVIHGHIHNLIEKGVDRIFYPMIFSERSSFTDAVNSYNCPIVTGYADVIRSAIDPASKYGVPLDMPSITFKDEQLLRKGCYHYLRQLGVRRGQFKRAFDHALAAQQEYRGAVRAEGARLLQEARKAGRQVILLMGRPYHLDPLINHGVPQILADLGVDVITEDAIPLEEQATLDNRHVPTQWEFVNRYYYAARWAGQQKDVEVVQLNSFACGPDAFSLDEVRSILAAAGKGYTVIRVDEIESTGSTRLRLRSLVETLRSGERQNRAPRPRKTMKLFEVEDRHRTIIVPHFSAFCAPIVAGPMLEMGHKIVTLPPPDRESVEIGLKYTPNEVCYPTIIAVGDIIKALQSGKYDLAHTAVGSWQTGGQCRATSILAMMRKAMIAAGFQDVPIVALTLNPKLHRQPGNNMNYLEYIPKAILACVFADAISTMYYATAIREVNKGETLALASEVLEPLDQGRLPLDKQTVLTRLRDAVARFNDIPTVDRPYPKVGIVGEIYVKYNAFSNNHVARWLMDQGIEVVVPDFLTFFLAWFVSSKVRVKENLAYRDLTWLIYQVLDWRVRSVLDEARQIMRGFKYHRPGHDIKDIAREAEHVVSLTHSYGESWLIAGEVGTLVESGIPNVVCLQPFGCIANQVTARGVAKRMKEHHPELNLLFLDLDAGLSEVNYFNRMHFFVSQAKSAVAG